jgi:hypothetical protein
MVFFSFSQGMSVCSGPSITHHLLSVCLPVWVANRWESIPNLWGGEATCFELIQIGIDPPFSGNLYYGFSIHRREREGFSGLASCMVVYTPEEM